MRRSLRFVVGVGIGCLVLAGYLYTVGPGTVFDRLTVVTPWVLGLVLGLVIMEGLADAIGVWASIAPLGDGISGPESVQFALAGDFFDTLSPAGPVSSEPIMARFFSVATGGLSARVAAGNPCRVIGFSDPPRLPSEHPLGSTRWSLPR